MPTTPQNAADIFQDAAAPPQAVASPRHFFIVSDCTRDYTVAEELAPEPALSALVSLKPQVSPGKPQASPGKTQASPGSAPERKVRFYDFDLLTPLQCWEVDQRGGGFFQTNRELQEIDRGAVTQAYNFLKCIRGLTLAPLEDLLDPVIRAKAKKIYDDVWDKKIKRPKKQLVGTRSYWV